MTTLKFLSRFLAGSLLAATCLTASAQATEGAAQPRAEDDTFLQLREAARKDNAALANALASRIPSYEIPSYVDYYRLKPRLADASEQEVRAFLAKYPNHAIADRLRNDWLLVLGKRRDWANFDFHFPQFVLKDDTQVKCYGLLSRAVKGQNVAAEARALLVNPPSYVEGCAALIARLYETRQFSEDDLVTQLRLAGEYDATGPAKRTAVLLGGSERHAGLAVDAPALALARGPGDTRVERELYIVALGRTARGSLKLATAALERVASRLTPAEREAAWATLALPASIQLHEDAHTYWEKAGNAPLSREAQQWKARTALRRGDWRLLRATIEAMPEAVRRDHAWLYWQARALQATGGSPEQARELYQYIADQGTFYGQLALEELGRMVVEPVPPAPPTAAEMAAVQANQGFRRALKFFDIGLRLEGLREWNWELRSMDERALRAAAEFARRNDVLDRMVHTAERMKGDADYSQRFPAPHADILGPATHELGLDKAWVYGLIRQESRFNSDARSHVGASGLMQVMPSTGKYVAGKIGLDEYRPGKLTDLRTNLVLGSNYLNMIMGRFEGSQVLATAAYNAGPGRARSWRNKMTAAIEGAVFAETIPFSETRGYVKNVMANATNYAAMFEKKPQSLKARLGKVMPVEGSGAQP
ncbi:transglycosylase SLT domain-containing protein [Pseudoduganella sp. GCM10020061]|uniref:lytic transglycosylase domain-containing protein n=1 Tax=Pseudoduganella sp. GCM10020061 TaxID=3317345 RepID=UPI00363A8270